MDNYYSLYLSFCREGPGISIGLNWALAGRGVIVNDKAFENLKPYELQQKGATGAESLSRLPVHVRGNVLGGSSEISKAQFSKLLKQDGHLKMLRGYLEFFIKPAIAEMYQSLRREFEELIHNKVLSF